MYDPSTLAFFVTSNRFLPAQMLKECQTGSLGHESTNNASVRLAGGLVASLPSQRLLCEELARSANCVPNQQHTRKISKPKGQPASWGPYFDKTQLSPQDCESLACPYRHTCSSAGVCLSLSCRTSLDRMALGYFQAGAAQWHTGGGSTKPSGLQPFPQP